MSEDEQKLSELSALCERSRNGSLFLHTEDEPMRRLELIFVEVNGVSSTVLKCGRIFVLKMIRDADDETNPNHLDPDYYVGELSISRVSLSEVLNREGWQIEGIPDQCWHLYVEGGITLELTCVELEIASYAPLR